MAASFLWKQLTRAGTPVARSSHGISVVGNTLLVYGGEHIARTPIDSAIHALDLSADDGSWSTIEATGVAPPPRVAHAQAVVGSSLYVFGGRQGIHMSEAPLNDLHKFDLETRAWSTIPPTDGVPSVRSFHKMVAVGPILYVFGGCGAEGRLADLHSFDTTTGTWQALPSAADAGVAGRGGAGFLASADNASLFVVAGFAGRETNDVHRYDIAAAAWSQVLPDGNDQLTPFSVSCGALVGGAMVFFGGEIGPSTKGHEGAGNFGNFLVVLDGVTGLPVAGAAPASGDAVPGARGWTSAGAWGGDKLVVFGGLAGDDENPLRLDDTWILQVGTA